MMKTNKLMLARNNKLQANLKNRLRSVLDKVIPIKKKWELINNH